jgi:hypothetical protein
MKTLLHRPRCNNSGSMQRRAAELVSPRLIWSVQAACDASLRRLGVDCIDRTRSWESALCPETAN